MSTRSLIAIAMPKGRYKSVYCHWDGYPKGVGQKLVAHYGSEKLARALIRLGSLSSLREKLSPRRGQVHTFNNPLPDVTIAYGRDRAETDVAPVVSVNFTALAAAALNSWADYIYVFDHGQWKFTPVSWVSGKPLPTDVDLQKLMP